MIDLHTVATVAGVVAVVATPFVAWGRFAGKMDELTAAILRLDETISRLDAKTDAHGEAIASHGARLDALERRARHNGHGADA